MAKLKIECYGNVSYAKGSTIPVPTEFLGVKEITTDTTSARVELESGTKLLSITTDDSVDIFYNLGDSTVTATTSGRVLKYFDARLYVDAEDNTYIACIKA